MKLALHVDHLGARGNGVVLYDYAHHAESLLGHESIILCPRVEAPPLDHDRRVMKRLQDRFPLHRYDRFDEVDPLLRELGVDVLYALKAGQRDHVVSRQCKTVVHAIFQHHEPHGDVYAYVSHWLSEKMTGGERPWVPHMVDLPDVSGDLRESLGVPRDAVVFGRHGGKGTFDIPFVHEAVLDTAKARPDVYFLFMSTDAFCPPRPNIIHLPSVIDLVEKVRFINTCDAMLHARKQGESFGLAVAEFSAKNRPVITFDGGIDRAHIEQLGDKGIYYGSRHDLMRILERFEPDPGGDWDAYSRDFAPAVVMDRFAEVFLS